MKTLLIVIVVSVAFACTTPTPVVETPEMATIIGVYNVISEPFRCALPSTNQVSIKQNGQSFMVSYTNTSTQKIMTVQGINAEKTADGFRLKLDENDFGRYVNDTYFGSNGQQKGMILFLKNQISQTEFLEFMGKK